MSISLGKIMYDFIFHYTEDSNKYSLYMIPASNEFGMIDIEPIE
jgi:hypothetical protein